MSDYGKLWEQLSRVRIRLKDLLAPRVLTPETFISAVAHVNAEKADIERRLESAESQMAGLRIEAGRLRRALDDQLCEWARLEIDLANCGEDGRWRR